MDFGKFLKEKEKILDFFPVKNGTRLQFLSQMKITIIIHMVVYFLIIFTNYHYVDQTFNIIFIIVLICSMVSCLFIEYLLSYSIIFYLIFTNQRIVIVNLKEFGSVSTDYETVELDTRRSTKRLNHLWIKFNGSLTGDLQCLYGHTERIFLEFSKKSEKLEKLEGILKTFK